MTIDDHRKAIQDDADDEMRALGAALHEAYKIARKLAARGAKMVDLGINPRTIMDLRDNAESAYTANKVVLP